MGHNVLLLTSCAVHLHSSIANQATAVIMQPPMQPPIQLSDMSSQGCAGCHPQITPCRPAVALACAAIPGVACMHASSMPERPIVLLPPTSQANQKQPDCISSQNLHMVHPTRPCTTSRPAHQAVDCRHAPSSQSCTLQQCCGHTLHPKKPSTPPCSSAHRPTPTAPSLPSITPSHPPRNTPHCTLNPAASPPHHTHHATPHQGGLVHTNFASKST
jgi:hypothetical protein